MKKLKFISSVGTEKRTYNIGEIHNIEDIQAESLIKASIAEEVIEEKPKKRATKSTGTVGE